MMAKMQNAFILGRLASKLVASVQWDRIGIRLVGIRRMSRIALRVSPIVSTQWVAEKVVENPPNFRILDGSWHMPFAKRNPIQEFYQSHIPGARFFGVDDCCDKDSQYDHMLPAAEQFEQYVGKLGISNNTHVVIYDNNQNFGVFSSQRVWWTFRAFGHTKVSIMDGGFQKWLSEGRAATDEIDPVHEETFKAAPAMELVKTYEQMEANLTQRQFLVMDARPTGRFEGTAPEPRPGIKPGHMPGAKNVPFTSILNPDTKTFRTPDEIQEAFRNAGIDLNQPLAASCGSGISACLLALAAYTIGKQDVAVYDGSWLEWYQRAHPRNRITSST